MASAQTPDFRLTSTTTGDEVRLVTRGELDLSCSAQVTEAVNTALQTTPARLIIDMADVSFIDSAGLRAVWDAIRRCHDRSIPITVIPSEPVRKLFDLLRLKLPTE